MRERGEGVKRGREGIEKSKGKEGKKEEKTGMHGRKGLGKGRGMGEEKGCKGNEG